MMDLTIIIYTFILLGSLSVCSSIEVELYDSTKMDSLDWLTWPDGTSIRYGWKEASYTDLAGNLLRVYTVCNKDSATLGNWLRMPFIEVGRFHRIFVDIKFTTWKCTVRNSSPESLNQCKETLKLLYLEDDSNVVANSSLFKESNFKLASILAANKLLTNSRDLAVNEATVSFPVSRAGISLVFYDQGACASLLSVRIHAVVCPSIRTNLAIFPETVPGSELTSVVSASGYCVKNAVSSEFPRSICKGDGDWFHSVHTSKGCECLPGYQPDSNASNCQACAPQFYKHTTGNEQCKPCPPKSSTSHLASICVCDSGYRKQLLDDNETFSCVESLITRQVKNVSAKFLHAIDCLHLHWDPLDHAALYEVKYMSENQVNSSRVFHTESRNCTICSLDLQFVHTFLVRGFANDTWSDFSEPVFFTIQPWESVDYPKLYVIVGSSGAAIFYVIFIAIVIFRRCHERQDVEKIRIGSPSDHLLNRADESNCKDSQAHHVYVDLDPTYVEPNMTERMRIHSELDPRLITIESVIHRNQLCDSIYKGKLNCPVRGDVTVAIKLLKQSSTETERIRFLQTAAVMAKLNHRNIVFLEGFTIKSFPHMIAYEYMPNGSLDSFLQPNYKNLTLPQLVSMMVDIASGMSYIAGKSFVHKDLSSRSVLVGSDINCKIASLDKCRLEDDNIDDNMETTSDEWLDVRRSAPEVLSHGRFTHSSDVWNFGIVVWEMLSQPPSTPYDSWSDDEIINATLHGCTLSAPKNCPASMYRLMQECWMMDRLLRPKFYRIVETLSGLAESPEILLNNCDANLSRLDVLQNCLEI